MPRGRSAVKLEDDVNQMMLMRNAVVVDREREDVSS